MTTTVRAKEHLAITGHSGQAMVESSITGEIVPHNTHEKNCLETHTCAHYTTWMFWSTEFRVVESVRDIVAHVLNGIVCSG